MPTNKWTDFYMLYRKHMIIKNESIGSRHPEEWVLGVDNFF